MRKPASMWSLETLGRVRLSKHFFMRDFLYSEIGNFYGMPNIPDDPDLEIYNGRQLCAQLLDPMQDTFGRIAIRSGYRSPTLNRFGNENRLNCAKNEANNGHHIWDGPEKGVNGAGVTVVIPWFADQYDAGRNWRDLAWWIHDHLPYSHLWFFPKLAAFNISWRADPLRTISSYIAPKGKLLAVGATPEIGLAQRRKMYRDFPPFRAIKTP
ncbi:MAG: hypothetical protein Q9M48_15710 [Rhodobacterales bacterium]|nr:hypothetical protein [Rhodobacterales bacterium]